MGTENDGRAVSSWMRKTAFTPREQNDVRCLKNLAARTTINTSRREHGLAKVCLFKEGRGSSGSNSRRGGGGGGSFTSGTAAPTGLATTNQNIVYTDPEAP